MLAITIIVLLGFCLLFAFVEGRRLVTGKDWKGLALASVILWLSIIYGLDLALNQDFLPNPGSMLNKLKPLADLVNHYLE